jgi:hypothetical protein
MQFPRETPGQTFDLIVLSEVGLVGELWAPRCLFSQFSGHVRLPVLWLIRAVYACPICGMTVEVVPWSATSQPRILRIKPLHPDGPPQQ